MKSENNNKFPHTTISAFTDVTTLVSVFTCEAEKQDEVITRLISGAETLMTDHPGFISSSVHRSEEANKVINYAQFRALSDLQSFRARPDAQAFFQSVLSLARAESDICRVEFVQLGVDSFRPSHQVLVNN